MRLHALLGLLFFPFVLCVHVKVNLQLRCHREDIRFIGTVQMLEVDTVTWFDDKISREYMFPKNQSKEYQAPNEFTVTIPSKEDVTDGYDNDEIEPYLNIFHDCHEDSKYRFSRVDLPYCYNILNRHLCEYNVKVDFGKQRKPWMEARIKLFDEVLIF